jgi:hypothetical protein
MCKQYDPVIMKKLHDAFCHTVTTTGSSGSKEEQHKREE